jgi:hypothetical protein
MNYKEPEPLKIDRLRNTVSNRVLTFVRLKIYGVLYRKVGVRALY